MIYEQIKTKISKFLLDLNGENRMQEAERGSPNDYVEDMTTYLNIIYVGLSELSKYYIETCFKDGVIFTKKTYADIIFNPNNIKNNNLYGIAYLKMDLDTLDKYFKEEIGLKYKGFDNCLFPIKNIIHYENKKSDNFYKIE